MRKQSKEYLRRNTHIGQNESTGIQICCSLLSSGYFSSDSMATLHLILFCNWKTQDSCAKKYFNIHISKITFARGKCSDIKSKNKTGFLTRLSNCLSIDSWGTSSDPEDAQTHSGGRGLFLPPALSLCSQGHLFVFQVNITPFCHASSTCFLPPLLCLPSPSPEFTQQNQVSAGRFTLLLTPGQACCRMGDTMC